MGNWIFRKKGLDIVLQAAEQLRPDHPDIEFRLIRDGKDRELLKQRIRTCPNVTLRGWCDAMGKEYSEMDLLVHASRDEGLGSSLLEAMSLGVPVIATTVGGIPEIVSDNYNGRPVAPNSALSISEAIKNLRRHPTLLKTLSDNAMVNASDYSALRMDERCYPHYLHLLKKKSI